MIHTFRIDRSQVIDKAETYSAYLAGKTGVDNYDHIRIKNADKDLIDIWFAEAGGEAVQLFLNYMTDTQDMAFNDEFPITCELSNMPRCMLAPIEAKLYDMFAYYILSKWFDMLAEAEPQVQQNHPSVGAAANFADTKEKLKHLLIRRKKPVRVKAHPF